MSAGRTVLAVDDSKLHHRMYELIFGQGDLSDVALLHAYDGRVGYELFIAHPEVTLGLLDLNMPVMNGLEFLKRRRDENLHPHVPIVLVTTESTAEDEARGIEAGAWGYLCKPFTPEQLIALVARASRRSTHVSARP